MPLVRHRHKTNETNVSIWSGLESCERPLVGRVLQRAQTVSRCSCLPGSMVHSPSAQHSAPCHTQAGRWHSPR